MVRPHRLDDGDYIAGRMAGVDPRPEPYTGRNPTWQDEALCRGAEWRDYFTRLGAAKVVDRCHRCPVFEECREFAQSMINNPDPTGTQYALYGLWAGVYYDHNKIKELPR